MTPSDFSLLIQAGAATLWHAGLVTLVVTCLVLLARSWAELRESDEDRARREAEAEASTQALDRAIDSAMASGGRWL